MSNWRAPFSDRSANWKMSKDYMIFSKSPSDICYIWRMVTFFVIFWVCSAWFAPFSSYSYIIIIIFRLGPVRPKSILPKIEFAECATLRQIYKKWDLGEFFVDNDFVYRMLCILCMQFLITRPAPSIYTLPPSSSRRLNGNKWATGFEMRSNVQNDETEFI